MYTESTEFYTLKFIFAVHVVCKPIKNDIKTEITCLNVDV